MADTVAQSGASPKSAAAPASPAKSGSSARSDSGLVALEVDNAEEVDDPTIDEQISAYTASLSSNVLDYPVEHGRRYHAYRKGSYVFPNDDRESERLDLVHSMVVKTIGGLYIAPIDAEKVQNILDIGTGTGSYRTPPNVKFEIDDVESEWEYPFSFDFIVSRYMSGSIGDWEAMAKRIHANLNTGGWVEFQGYDITFVSDDGTLKDDDNLQVWSNTLLNGLRSMNREPCPGPKLHPYAEKAGFVDIREEIFKIPIGPWAKDPSLKEIGMMNLVQLLDGIEGVSVKLFDLLGWTEVETQVLLAGVRKELKGRAFHAYCKLHVVYGRRAEE